MHTHGNGMNSKVALITGGTRGIGRAIAFELARRGCSVAVNFVTDHESADSTLAELRALAPKAIAIKAHIGDESSRRELWSAFDAEFNHLDYFIANAATGVHRPLETLSVNSLGKVLAVNVEGFQSLSQEARKRMLAQKPDGDARAGARGRIIALSSSGAERVIENYGSVAASKAALEALCRQLAWELGPLGINCNVVRAGLVDTGILDYIQGKAKIIADTIARTPNRRLVTPDDVARFVAFLVSEDASMINGQTMMVDGGFHLQA